MVFQLSHFWIIFLDIAVWAIMHLVLSYICSIIPLYKFNPKNRWYRIKDVENNGKIYTGFFRIKRWKQFVPDGARLFKNGFPKKTLQSGDRQYLKTFMLETCRGELAHWLQILPAGIFFLWNIWWAGIIMIVYALCVNIPCILLQRYNRARLQKIIEKM
jgi:glycosyl-4,4'-diaponeurosporenoate acyltransferase